MIKFEDFKILFSLCNLTTTHINIGPRMVEAMTTLCYKPLKSQF
jgi:hypothetical protein